MAAEARALLHYLGPERLPRTWADKRGATLAEAAEYAKGDDVPSYKKHAIEVQLELDRVARRVHELMNGATSTSADWA